MKEQCCGHYRGGTQSEALYGLGVLGAIVYFMQGVVGFWPVIVAVLKAFIWPAFVVFKILGMLSI